jgi:hypothetical protein
MLTRLTTLVLVGLAVIERVAAAITPRNTTMSYTIGPKDQVAVRMVELFNLAKSKGQYFTSSKGQVYNVTTELVTRSLEQYNINVIHQIIDLGNSLVGILYDQKNLMIIPISADGKSIGEPRVVVNDKLGLKEICDDLVVNTNAARIYMSCHDDKVTSEEPGKSYIYEIDYQSKTIINRIIIDQSDGFYVEYASKLRLINIIQGGSRQRILIFYSQYFVGTASTGFSHNRFFRYCVNADTGNLNCDPKYTVNLTNTNLNFRVINDIYFYYNQLVFVGVPTQGPVNGAASLRSCMFEYQDSTIACVFDQRDTNITKGWVGITNNNKYIEVDLVTKTIELCDLQGSFYDEDWNTRCLYNDTVDAFDGDVFIREVEMDNSACTIEFVHPDTSYLGFSVHVFFSGNYHSDFKSTFPATLAEDRLIRINPDPTKKTVGIVWLVPEFALIDAKDFSGNNTITITAYDEETPAGVSVSIKLEVLADYIGYVAVNPNYKPAEMDIMQGSFYRWPLNYGTFIGNALDYSLSFDSAYEGLFEQHIYHTFPADMNLDSDDPANLDLAQVVVGSGFTVGIDRRNNLIFFKCSFKGLASALCSAKAVIPVPAGTILGEKTNQVGNAGFVYTYSRSAGVPTSIYLFDGTNVGNFTVKTADQINDVDAFTITTADNRQAGAIAYALRDSVQLLEFHIGDVNSIRPWMALTSANTQDGYLCPQKVNGNSRGFLAVTSLCSGEIFSDTRIVVFSFPGPRSIVEVPLPNDGSHTSPQACYFGHSLLIYGFDAVSNTTSLYMTSGLDADPSEEHFGLEDYGITDVHSVHCAEEADLFTVYGNNQDGTKNMAVFYATSRGRAGMRAHSVKKNLKISNAVSYGFGETAMVHVIYDMDGYPLYWVSERHGPILYTDVSTDLKKNLRMLEQRVKGEDKVRTLNVGFVATNPKNIQGTTTTSFILRSPDTEIHLTNIKNAAVTVNQTIDLEELVDIDGPVFNLDVNGVDRFEDVMITHRIHPVSFARRSGGLIYKYICMAAQRTYAVESRNDYTKVDFYEHGAFVKTLSGLGVAGELLSFTAVTIDFVKGVDVLFYSYIEGQNPKLVLQIYENGVRRSVTTIESIRIFPADLKAVRVNSTTVYLFAQTERDIEFFLVTIPDYYNIRMERLYGFEGFLDFSVVFGGEQVLIVGFGFDVTHFMGYSISTQDPHTISGPSILDAQHNYRLYKVNCKNFNSTHMVCIANTQSSFLTENYIDYHLSSIESHTHTKFSYYEGYEVDVAGDFLYMFGRTNTPGIFSMAILTWKTRKSGGNGKLWYGLNLPIPSDADIDMSYQAPFVAAFDDADTSAPPISYLLVGFLMDTIPMGVFENSTFKLNLTNQNLDLSKVTLSFQGLSTSEIPLSQLLTKESSSSIKAWPFFLMIGLLILAAIAWFVYARIKSMKEQEPATESGKYGTINETEAKKTLKDL